MDILKGVLSSLGVEGEKLLTNIVAFLIFFGILYQFAWKKLGGTIEDRRERIRRELDDIEKGKQDIERLKEEYRTKIREIQAEAELRFGRIEREAGEKAYHILSEASDKAHKYLETSRQTIAQEAEQARRALMAEITALARAAAEKVLEREIDEADNRKLVESFLADLEKHKTAG